jgi:hypothetical protein
MPKMVRFDIQKCVDFLLDEDKLDHRRAIKLFEFLVATHVGRPYEEKFSNLIIRVPKQILRAARLFAATGMFAAIEKEWAKANPGVKPKAATLARVPEYSEIYNKVWLKTSGWNAQADVPSREEFIRDLRKPRRQAKQVAKLIEISCRCALPHKPGKKVGISMAIATAAESGYVGRGKTMLWEYWEQLTTVAPFLYLIYVQKHPYWLNRIDSERFGIRLLRKIRDRGALLEFFEHYNAVVWRLSRDYNYSQLKVPEHDECGLLTIQPFDPKNEEEKEIASATQNYRG